MPRPSFRAPAQPDWLLQGAQMIRRRDYTGTMTAQERRVAEMAAQDSSNPEIAQKLFVTRRTVETPLRHAVTA
jgi:DNA-binding CsgD family transcriptional regulator